MRAWMTLHVLAAIAALGPEIAFGIMGPGARRAGAGPAAAVYTAIAAARARIVYPALALQVTSGVALIVGGPSGLLHEEWLIASLVAYGVAIALVAAVLVPGSARARRALAEGVAPDHPSLGSLWTRQAAVGGIAGSLLIAVAVLMVVKPG